MSKSKQIRERLEQIPVGKFGMFALNQELPDDKRRYYELIKQTAIRAKSGEWTVRKVGYSVIARREG
mgnify:CR=1 FL=1